RLRHDGTHMGLDAEDNAMLLRPLDPPRKLVATALPGLGRLFAGETNTRQRGDVLRAAGSGVIQRLEKPVTRVAAAGRLGMIDGVGGETRSGLEEHVRTAQAVVGELAAKQSPRFDWRAEHPRG